MLKNFLLIGTRNLLKQRGYSIIKIAGLALGLAASMMIFLFVREDLSYDRFNTNYDRIVRVLTIDKGEGVSSKLVGVTPPALGPAVAEELPEVINEVRISNQGRYDLSYNDKSLKCENAFYTETSFFDVFDFKIADGDKKTILDKPNSIAITRSLAKKIFGDENPVGKTVRLNQKTDLFVSALLEDPSKNSHLRFDLLRSLVAPADNPGFQQYLQSWQGISVHTYLLLDKPANVEDLNSKIQAISTKNKAVDFFIPVVQPLSKVHLYSKEILFEANADKSDILNVYVLSTIAILILILAVVNFTNLVTANATGRAKEVGVRKVIGAVRSQLIIQHLTESVMITTCAAALAIGVTYSLVTPLNNLYQRFADFRILLQPANIIVMILGVLLIGLIAGIYPAFVLSAFRPVLVLKGAFKSSAGGLRLRKGLVVLQFTISIALMVGTGIIYQQMQFINTADLGYNRDQVIIVQQSGQAISRSKTLKTELLRNNSITNVGTATNRIGQQLGRTQIYPEGVPSETNIITSVMGSDETLIPTLSMSIVAGRNFSADYADSSSMIINEEMAKMLKWKDAIGRRISLQTGATPQDLTNYTVVGVVKDFHFATIRHKLEPMFMQYSPENSIMAIKIKAGEIKNTLSFIESTWKKVNPGTTFDYNFLDEQFANLYRNEQAFAAMFSHFTLLAMTIAVLGLFALSAFTAEQRKKEIGIRKIMGASDQHILFILSKEFVVLIMIAFVLASGISWYVMTAWLKDFSYSIRIGAGIFIVAGALSVIIALITTSFQALKAAFTKPVESLRAE